MRKLTAIQNDISDLNDLLERVESMSEMDVCDMFNSDTKEDFIEVLNEELAILEEEQSEYMNEEYDSSYDVEEERCAICAVQGLSRYC